MVGVQKLEHVELTVDNLDETLRFNTEVLGLSELDRQNGTIYLGCDLNGNYDLAVSEGEPGLDHFAVRVEDDAALDAHIDRLRQAEIDFTIADDEPNQERGIRIETPGGVTLELALVEDTTYRHPASGSTHSRQGPRDIDHINLCSPDPEVDAEFLSDVLGFRLSDVFNPGAKWLGAWLRYGDYHHDVALNYTEAPDQRLHHIAWTLDDISHVKTLCDTVAREAIDLELGVNRHAVGGNIFAYFWAPGGHRYELSTEMETLDRNTEPTFHDSVEEVLTAWGGITRPKSFDRGS